jgi:hypothetical protein
MSLSYHDNIVHRAIITVNGTFTELLALTCNSIQLGFDFNTFFILIPCLIMILQCHFIKNVIVIRVKAMVLPST